jgi:hypothetical protein
MAGQRRSTGGRRRGLTAAAAAAREEGLEWRKLGVGVTEEPSPPQPYELGSKTPGLL